MMTLRELHEALREEADNNPIVVVCLQNAKVWGEDPTLVLVTMVKMLCKRNDRLVKEAVLLLERQMSLPIIVNVDIDQNESARHQREPVAGAKPTREDDNPPEG